MSEKSSGKIFYFMEEILIRDLERRFGHGERLECSLFAKKNLWRI